MACGKDGEIAVISTNRQLKLSQRLIGLDRSICTRRG